MSWQWEGQVSKKRCRRLKMRLNEIQEDQFLDFMGLTNDTKPLSSIELFNDIIQAFLYPWRNLVNGAWDIAGAGYGHIGLDLRRV
jgi:hypothetical protein